MNTGLRQQMAAATTVTALDMLRNKSVSYMEASAKTRRQWGREFARRNSFLRAKLGK